MSTKAAITALATKPRSGVGGWMIPRSITCWIVTGMTMRPTVASTASVSVSASPSKISGLSRRPRRTVLKPPSIGAAVVRDADERRPVVSGAVVGHRRSPVFASSSLCAIVASS